MLEDDDTLQPPIMHLETPAEKVHTFDKDSWDAEPDVEKNKEGWIAWAKERMQRLLKREEIHEKDAEFHRHKSTELEQQLRAKDDVINTLNKFIEHRKTTTLNVYEIGAKVWLGKKYVLIVNKGEKLHGRIMETRVTKSGVIYGVSYWNGPNYITQYLPQDEVELLDDVLQHPLDKMD